MENDYMDNLFDRIRETEVILKTRKEKEELLRALQEEKEPDGWVLIYIWIAALVICTIALMSIGFWHG